MSSSDRLLANLLTVILFLSPNVAEHNIHYFMMMLYNCSVKALSGNILLTISTNAQHTSPYQ